MSATLAGAPRGRQAAAGLLLAAVVAVGAIFALPTWALYHRYDRELTERTEKLERYRRIAATRNDVGRQLEAMRARDARRFFLRQSTAALANAEVQEIVRAMVEGAGARLITMQALPAKDDGRYRLVATQVQLAGNIFALRTLLHRVETHVPYLFVENLMVKSQVPANFKPGPGAEPEMFVTLEVHGYTFTGAQ